jgi:ABC-type lipoprotein export system ATPase subunit
VTIRYPRGSEWRQWDLHIHTPASFHWEGQRFECGGNGPHDAALIDEMVSALNDAAPAVYGIQDYWHFDGWFALKRRLKEPGGPALEKTVFPGIELRIAAPMAARLNAHVIFSDEIPDQLLRDFLSNLKLEITGQPVSEHALITYARGVNADKLKLHGFDKAQVQTDDQVALRAGHVTAEITVDSYKAAVRGVPDGFARGFMPFETNDGLATIKHLEHYAYAIGLVESSPIFETRNEALWNAFVGRRIPENEKFFDAFQESIGNTPRLPVSGSDAHRCRGVPGDNNVRGYGDFPSQRITWIKADPTWRGLQQAIMEPQKRCFIGTMPPKLDRVSNNKTFYIDEISLAKVDGSPLGETWFDGCKVPLNSDLVAIIGNKGSGKSALADVLALVGNSQQHSHFSFLKPDRFRGKAGEPARQFEGELRWLAGEPTRANLAENPAADRVELVRYVPQGRFEALCNEHVTGRSENFERELRSVIFSHIPSEERLGALDFDQLIEAQEAMLRVRLDEARKNMTSVNRAIAVIEDQLHPTIRRNVEEQIRLKAVQLAEIDLLKPPAVAPPAETLTVTQQAAAATLAEIASEVERLDEEGKATGESLTGIAARRKAARNVRERLGILKSQIIGATSEIADDLQLLALTADDILVFEIKYEKLTAAEEDAGAKTASLAARAEEIKSIKEGHADRLSSATEALNGPQRIYQDYLGRLKAWQASIDAIQGTADIPDSKKGLEARLVQLDHLPAALVERRAHRAELAGDILDVLALQRDQRSKLFEPVQSLIQENSIVGDEYRLQFESNLAAYHDAFSEKLFSLVKQSIGELRGEDESRAAVKMRIEAHDLNSKGGALAFVEDLHRLLHESARRGLPDQADVMALMRKDRSPSEVYDLVYAFEYLEPKYTLLFQDTQIEQLSPGQRGALLLIFYLLVDRKRNPIILDQPEENLDNETIVSLLVPVLNAAKENRQIIMVTHNPNLAVVCDAEQIIFAEFDRKSMCSINYLSGAIEDAELNRAVVNVLEGTKPAFNNRGQKYQ